MKISNPFTLKFITITFLCFIVTATYAKNETTLTALLKQINATPLKTNNSSKNKIVIAIVDDGVRITHQNIKNYIWLNPQENPNNGMDDEGNGFINDMNGWDVADNNNLITPPENTRFDFYHGTHLAGIITKIAESVYGENAPELIKIMPVKSIKDTATTPYIKHGYQGIQYAIDSGADIILTAWAVGKISDIESNIIRQAEEKGILLVASAGNLSTNTKQYPAAQLNVLSVATIDSHNKKFKHSNYGAYVDISAPGVDVISASFNADNEYEKHSGTSQSAAIMAAVTAIVKLQNPDYSWEEIKACIKNSAVQIDTINSRFSNKLGAGAVNLTKAVACESLNQNDISENELTNSHGYLNLTVNEKKSSKSYFKKWLIKPNGRFKGLEFRKASLLGDTSDAVISIHKGVSDYAPAFLEYELSKLPDTFYLPAMSATVRLKANSQMKGLIEYKTVPIDFTKLYCQGTKYIKQEGVIEDGSGPENYSYNSNCKWLITAPKGNVIRFQFTELDTESKIDKIHFFNGEGTHEKIMAVISGSKLPPSFYAGSNKVLIWFIADDKNEGNGWKLTYTFVDADNSKMNQ